MTIVAFGAITDTWNISIGGGGRGWGELFTCPYPMKVQACPP